MIRIVAAGVALGALAVAFLAGWIVGIDDEARTHSGCPCWRH